MAIRNSFELKARLIILKEMLYAFSDSYDFVLQKAVADKVKRGLKRDLC